jgi:hypothetical protein
METYLRNYDIYDLAISLVNHNTKWLFVRLDETRAGKIMIDEGMHRLMALRLLANLGLIGWDTKFACVNKIEKIYPLLWRSELKNYWDSPVFSTADQIQYNDIKYNISNAHTGGTVGLLYHRLLYASAILTKHLDDFISWELPGAQIIQFNLLKSKDEIVKILLKQQERSINNDEKHKYLMWHN